ncbi:hypothetical protein AAG906_027415 [Vitis piasezkii]
MEIDPVVLAKSVAIETIPLIVVVVDILVTTLTTKMQLLMLITLRLPISTLLMTITDMTSSMLVMDKPSYFLVKDQVSKKILLEYRKLNTYFKQVGIVHRLACPHTHEQNGVTERKIRHLVDISLALLAHANLPLRYWNYAFEMSYSSINNLPTPILNNSSHTLTPCVYLGPSPSHSGSRCLNLSNDRVRPLLPNIPLFSTTDQSSNTSLLSAQSPSLTTPPSSHSPIPQQSPSSDSTTNPPLSLIVDLTHYPAQLNSASSTSTSPPRIHSMQLRSSTMQNDMLVFPPKLKLPYHRTTNLHSSQTIC